MKKIVLKIQYGGLGDHLLYSPIPRIAKEKFGYDKVFISNYSEYRNPNTKRLVWEYNPFVDGFINENAATPSFVNIANGKNIIDAIVDFLGIPDDGERFRNPEIYYIPKKIDDLENKIVYDPNFISKINHPNSEMVKKYLDFNGVNVDFQMKKMFNNSSITDVKELVSDSLEHFCDIIFSCKKFYCLTSGSATLASSLRKPSSVLYREGVNIMFHHCKIHNYIKL